MEKLLSPSFILLLAGFLFTGFMAFISGRGKAKSAATAIAYSVVSLVMLIGIVLVWIGV